MFTDDHNFGVKFRLFWCRVFAKNTKFLPKNIQMKAFHIPPNKCQKKTFPKSY